MKHLGIIFFLIAPLAAQEPGLREQLREALYTEEVERNPEAAARQYEALLAGFGKQRALAATAVFRLAEVRRKQDRKDEAIALYERLLREFPEFETEGKLARENLTVLGAKPAPEAGPGPPPTEDPEEAELQRLQELARTSPDLLLGPYTLNHAIGKKQVRVIRYLLTEIKNPGDDISLLTAVNGGNLSICKLLLQHLKPTPNGAGHALKGAIESRHFVILETLLDSGLDPGSPIFNGNSLISTPLVIASEQGDKRALTLLLERGADINYMIESPGVPYTGQPLGTALHMAVLVGHEPRVRLLLEKGAAPDLPTTKEGITPLHFAAVSQNKDTFKILELLLSQEVDVNRRTTLDKESAVSAGEFYAERTPLELALVIGNDPAVQPLIEAGAKLESGSDLLFRAIRDEKWNRLKLLLQAGADPNAVDSEKFPALLRTVFKKSAEGTRILLEAGADPNAALPQQTSLIQNAIAVPAPECVRLLLATGKVTGLDEALRTAIGLNATGMVEILLEGGVDPNSAGPAYPPPQF
jgi:ankyrin repeat protein